MLTADIDKRAMDFVVSMKKPGAQPALRDLTHAAQALLAMEAAGAAGGSAADAEALMSRAFALQPMDSAAKDYGTFPWQEGHPEIQDANSVDFTMRPLAAIFARYADRLSPSFRAAALPHLKAGLIALERHQVAVAYTNIHVMNLVSLIILGETLGDAQALAKGSANLEEWMKQMAATGFGEYDSPTYTAVQIASLSYGYNLVKDAGMKAEFKSALDRLWADVTANFFAGAGTLSGSHSRDYDFLSGRNFLDRYYYLEGLIPGMGDGGLNDVVSMALGESEGDYRPPADFLKQAPLGERIIRSRYGTVTGQDRYNYVTLEYAIGSSGAWYGPQDKQVSVQFATAKKAFPNVAVWFDRFDSPYGQVKTPDRSGHLKASHLRNLIAAVQEKGALLILLDGAPGLAESGTPTLATDIILPLSPDSAMLDGHALSLVNGGAALDKSVALDAVFGFREGDAALGIRVFRAEGCRGQAPVLRLKNDGADLGATRLAIYHYRGDSVSLVEKKVRTGLLLIAGKVDAQGGLQGFLEKLRDPAAKIVQTDASNGDWQVMAQMPGLKLEAALGAAPVYRRVNGKDFISVGAFSVDGQGWDAYSPVGASVRPDRPALSLPRFDGLPSDRLRFDARGRLNVGAAHRTIIYFRE